jgi:hypothetical protein
MPFDCGRNVALAVLVGLWPCVVPFSAAQQSAEPVRLSAHPVPLDLSWLMPEEVLVLSPQRMHEVEEWTRAFDEWQKWVARWLNRRQPGFWSIGLERSKKPDPPMWLEDACELLSADENLARPCTARHLARGSGEHHEPSDVGRGCDSKRGAHEDGVVAPCPS